MGLGLGTAETPDRAVVWYDFFLNYFPPLADVADGMIVLAVWCLVGGNMSMLRGCEGKKQPVWLLMSEGHWSALLPALEAE